MKIKTLLTTWFGIFLPLLASSQPAGDPSEAEAVATVKQIYKMVSSEANAQVSWDSVRSFFTEEAVIVLRNTRNTTKQFTLDGFIQDFKDFYNNPGVRESGFKEEVLSVKSHLYKEMAFIGVVYSASILNSGRPPQQGIDFWLLAHRDGAWKVMAVTNEVIPPGDPPPEMFD